MVIIIIIFIVLFVLTCLFMCGIPRDVRDDEGQEEFLRKYNDKHKK